MSGPAGSRLARDTRGAVFVEHAVVAVPVALLALCTWSAVELCAGDLLVRRAAGAAARAAVVVLPDDPAYYAGVPVDEFSGARQTEIELAAALVLAASSNFAEKPRVEVSGAVLHQSLSVTVSAPFRCIGGLLNVVCGGRGRVLSAEASLPYQGASYLYE
jgi:Flp pilus assembly protein TadG